MAEVPCEGWTGTHVVIRGETMWRLSRRYGVSLEELARCNDIPDPTRLETGHALHVPRLDNPETFVWPVQGKISSGFGPRRGSLHRGIDVRAPHGTRIRASRDGRVSYSGNGMRGYGNVVILDHGDGFETVYAHNAKNLVRRGDRVDPGEVIGLVGRTGNATAPHVHFEVRRHRQPVDPLRYLAPRARRAASPSDGPSTGRAAAPVR